MRRLSYKRFQEIRSIIQDQRDDGDDDASYAMLEMLDMLKCAGLVTTQDPFSQKLKVTVRNPITKKPLDND